jgi:hypothetical protein
MQASGMSDAFAEERAMTTEKHEKDWQASPRTGTSETAHFSQWWHLRRAHYASKEQIASHVGALRAEWDRR